MVRFIPSGPSEVMRYMNCPDKFGDVISCPGRHDITSLVSQEDQMSEPKLSRRQLATAGATAVAALGAAGAGRAQQAAPDALKSEFLMDLILETGGPGGGN